MLRFAVVASVLGLTAAIFFVAANEISAIETPQILWALCAGVFVAFIPAVLGHPKASYEGTTVSVDPRQTIRSAPWWSTVLVGLAMLATLSLSLALPESEFGFGSRANILFLGGLSIDLCMERGRLVLAGEDREGHRRARAREPFLDEHDELRGARSQQHIVRIAIGGKRESQDLQARLRQA